MAARYLSTHAIGADATDDSAMALPTAGAGYCCKPVRTMDTKIRPARAPSNRPPVRLSRAPKGNSDINEDPVDRSLHIALVTIAPIPIIKTKTRKNPANTCLDSLSTKKKISEPAGTSRPAAIPRLAIRKRNGTHILNNPPARPARAPNPQAASEIASTQFTFPV